MKRIIGSLLLSTVIMYAEGSFSLGHKHFSFSISQDNDYTVLGGSVNYFPIDNVSVGLSLATWIGDGPSINQFTVPVTYYVPMQMKLRPYVGAFFSYTSVGDDGDIINDDYSSYGARVGAVLDISAQTYSYAGWVQEKFNDDRTDDTRGYPEFGIVLSF